MMILIGMVSVYSTAWSGPRSRGRPRGARQDYAIARTQARARGGEFYNVLFLTSIFTSLGKGISDRDEFTYKKVQADYIKCMLSSLSDQSEISRS